MSDWYVSSTAYAAIPTFQTNHAYSVGDIVRPTSPTLAQQYPQRCTTAGTSGGTEPAWSNNNNSTTTSSGAVFTNVAGQSTYGWSAAIGSIQAFNNSSSKQPSVGDRIFVSSDHSESITGNAGCKLNGNNSFNTIKVLSVNKAGSVPPVAADLLAGASIACTGDILFDQHCMMYWDGVYFSTSGNNIADFNNAGGDKTSYYKNCKFTFSNSSGGRFDNTQGACKIVFDNTIVVTATTGFTFKASNAMDFTWINTPSAFAGSSAQPTKLFNNNNGGGMMQAKIRGVDLSYLTGTLLGGSFASDAHQIIIEGCKINSAVTRYQAPTDGNSLISFDEIELINCYDGTNVINERHTPHGSTTTDRSKYLTSGAADDFGNYSLKMVTNNSPTSELLAGHCESLWFDVENTAVGSSKTATVEIVSSASLNTTDIKLQLEYPGTASSPEMTFKESNVNALTASAALPTSSASWTSPPGTPVYQQLSVTFTPQQAGRVRGKVLLGAANKTVYVNPQIAVA